MIYSVDCERCHGPGAEHVNFQTENPGIKTARYIVPYNSLSRSQKVDMCAQCHSGNKGVAPQSIFFFKPGDTLTRYVLPDFYSDNDTLKAEVHGHQTQLLKRSKCFINSKMDCATCHNTHEDERGNIALYNQRCKTCHAATSHDFSITVNAAGNNFINSNCTKCHMPAQSSRAIVMQTSAGGSPLAVSAINHRIAIYPEETKKVLIAFTK